MEVSVGKSPINGEFSIAMFEYQRVSAEFFLGTGLFQPLTQFFLVRQCAQKSHGQALADQFPITHGQSVKAGEPGEPTDGSRHCDFPYPSMEKLTIEIGDLPVKTPSFSSESFQPAMFDYQRVDVAKHPSELWGEQTGIP